MAEHDDRTVCWALLSQNSKTEATVLLPFKLHAGVRVWELVELACIVIV